MKKKIEEKIKLIRDWCVGKMTCPKCGKRIKIIHCEPVDWKPRKNFKYHKLEEG